jgi:hypothetical protein
LFRGLYHDDLPWALSVFDQQDIESQNEQVLQLIESGLHSVRYFPGPWQISSAEFFGSSPNARLPSLTFLEWFAKLSIGPLRGIARNMYHSRIWLDNHNAISALGLGRSTQHTNNFQIANNLEIVAIPELAPQQPPEAAPLAHQENLADFLAHQEQYQVVLSELLAHHALIIQQQGVIENLNLLIL